MARYIPPKPPPGPQQPQKYPMPVGPLYRELGEQPGYIYNPYTDKYTPNPKTQQEILEAQGLGPEKPPSLMDQLLPVAVLTAGGAAAYGIGSDPGAFIEGLGSAGESVGGFFGLGGGPATQATAANAGTAASTGVLGAAPISAAGTATELAPYGTMQFGGEAVGTLAPAAEAAAAPGLVSLQGLGGAAGLALGSYGMYNAFESGDEVGGALSGAGAGLGAGMLTSAMGAPLLMSLGLGPLAPLAIGGALLGLGLGALGGPTAVEKAKAKERKRMDKVLEAGTAGYGQFVDILRNNETANMRGLVDERVSPDFVGFTESGERLNNKFAASRDVGDLEGVDVWGNVSFWEQFGDRWIGELTPAERALVAQKALDLGLVKEGEGVIKVEKSEELVKYLDELRKQQGGPIQDDWMKIDYAKYGVGQSKIEQAEEEQKAPSTQAPAAQTQRSLPPGAKVATGPISTKPQKGKGPMALKYEDLFQRVVAPQSDGLTGSTLKPVRGSKPTAGQSSTNPFANLTPEQRKRIEEYNTQSTFDLRIPPELAHLFPGNNMSVPDDAWTGEAPTKPLVINTNLNDQILNELSGIKPIVLPAGARTIAQDVQKIPVVKLPAAATPPMAPAGESAVAVVEEPEPVVVKEPTSFLTRQRAVPNPGPMYDHWAGGPGAATLRLTRVYKPKAGQPSYDDIRQQLGIAPAAAPVAAVVTPTPVAKVASPSGLLGLVSKRF